MQDFSKFLKAYLGCWVPRVAVAWPDREGWNAVAIWRFEVVSAHAFRWDVAAMKALAGVVHRKVRLTLHPQT